MNEILSRLRNISASHILECTNNKSEKTAKEEIISSGVKFVSDDKMLEKTYYHALNQLIKSVVVPSNMNEEIVYEGAIYHGSWLESIINLEKADRFLKTAVKNTYDIFIENQREDGLIPFMIDHSEGARYWHLQIVTPLARCIYNHYLNNKKDKSSLKKTYKTMEKYELWLEKFRNTRGTGCVEAFCICDTGHDNSCRFWAIPEETIDFDAKKYDKDNPLLPYLAPDLTATSYANRKYLALIAKELGLDEKKWEKKAQETLSSLMKYCYDKDNDFFYDLDRNSNYVRIQSDILLRVLACEVGNEEFFKRMLKKYLLNSRKFYAKYPLTSIALDDPRFETNSTYNTWSGPTNLLTLLRTPHAFLYHGHYVELTWIMQPIVFAMKRYSKFAQAINPWTGIITQEGGYCPAILTYLDFIERLCGILPEKEEINFTGLNPYAYWPFQGETGYSRIINDNKYELINGKEYIKIYKNERLLYTSVKGIRIVTDINGSLKNIIGMSLEPVKGEITYKDSTILFTVSGNEILEYENNVFKSISQKEIIYPTT